RRLSKQKYVESEVNHRRPIRFGILPVGLFSHVDAVFHSWEAWAVRCAIARRLPAFLMGPLQRHRIRILALRRHVDDAGLPEHRARADLSTRQYRSAVSWPKTVPFSSSSIAGGPSATI